MDVSCIIPGFVKKNNTGSKGRIPARISARTKNGQKKGVPGKFPKRPACFVIYRISEVDGLSLDNRNIHCRRTFLSLFHGKGDFIALIQGSESI